MATLSDEMLADAREWLIDCFPDQEDEILEASARTISREVERLYDGGLAAFIATHVE